LVDGTAVSRGKRPVFVRNNYIEFTAGLQEAEGKKEENMTASAAGCAGGTAAYKKAPAIAGTQETQILF
jgi:hypothetical protein